MDAMSRRAFLEGAAVSAASAILPRGAAAADRPRAAQAQATTWHPAPCEFCGVGCGLLVAVRDGRAVAAKGDPEARVNAGSACARGYFAVQALQSDERRTSAMLRRNGVLVPVALDEALDAVARALRDVVARHGAGAATLLHGSGPTTANLALRSAFGDDARRTGFDDIDHADVVLLWEHNVAEEHPVLFSRMLQRRRRDAGVRIVDVATRTTRTSYAADRALHYDAGAGLTLLNAVAQAVVASHGEDRAFIERHVAFRHGQGNTASWSQYRSFLERFRPERVAQETGMPAEEIRWLASLLADRSRRVLSMWGPQFDQDARGVWMNEALHGLHLLTGRVGAPGDGTLPLDAPPSGLADGPPAAGTMLSAFRGLARGTTRFLWVHDVDPFRALPNAEQYLRAPATRDAFVVLSSPFPLRADAIADVVLPSALWIEREGVIATADGGIARVPALVAPPAHTLAPRAQLQAVSRRAGAAWPFPPPDETARARATAAPLPRGARTGAAPQPFAGHPDGRAWVWMRRPEPAGERPDSRFPFRLARGEVLEHAGHGEVTMHAPALRRAMPGAYVEMHRDDAAALDLRDRERVRLVSRRGALELPLRLDHRSQPARGCVFVPTFDPLLPIDALALDSTSPESGEPDFACAVRVERITGGHT